MSTTTDLVTGAFSYSGAHLAQRLLESGREVRTLTHHPDRAHPLQGAVDARPYRFDDPAQLARSLEGVSTLYNTFWVRFDHGPTSFVNAVESSRMLFYAAQRAGVERIVHVSITNPALDSPLPYFRGKALVEYALAQAGVRYAIVRPTLIFGGERDVLVNNIAWILRRLPAFAIPGDGAYPVAPVHVGDLARICLEVAHADRDLVVDAAGPETMAFRALVELIRACVGSHSPVVSIPPSLMAATARLLGLALRDVVLTGDEIRGLMAGLLVSDAAPLGQIALTRWLSDHAATVGLTYANELERHFAPAALRA